MGRKILMIKSVLVALALAVGLTAALALPQARAARAPSSEDVLALDPAQEQEEQETAPDEETPAAFEQEPQDEANEQPAQQQGEAEEQAAQEQEAMDAGTTPATPPQPTAQQEPQWDERLDKPDPFGLPETEAKAMAMAEKVAENWLKLVDRGGYALSWDKTSKLFKLAVDQKEWVQQLKATRAPMGQVISRKRANAQYTETLPGAPDGVYVVFRFGTTFSRKTQGVETVTMQLEPPGVWRVGGYFIR